jgi:hypothetical protein
MCPACLATLSMIVAGVISTGGATALVAKSLGRRTGSAEASAMGGNLSGKQLRIPEKKEKQS